MTERERDATEAGSGSRLACERGVTLVEALVGIVIFAIVVLGFGGAAALAVQKTAEARDDVHLWAAVQRTADSLMAEGYGNVTDGSWTVEGYTMSWTVTGTNPERIDLEYTRPLPRSTQTTVDTLTMYLSN